MSRYFLRLSGVHSGVQTDLEWMKFRTRRAAEQWATTNQNAYTDPRLNNAQMNTRWSVMDRGPWWARMLGQEPEPVDVAQVDGLIIPDDQDRP